VQQQPIEVLNNNAQHDKNNIETDQLDREPDAFDRESLNLIQEQDRAIDVEAVTTILQDSTHDPVLSLHNSFVLLEDDSEQPAREAGLVETVHSHKITELQATFVDNVGTAVNGDANLIQINTLETPSELKKRKSQTAVLDSGAHVMNDGTEKPVFLIPSSSPPLQGNNTERPSFVKVTLDNNTSHPSMPQPVTISYDSLTSDKLLSNQNLDPASKPSLHSAAALKSVHILSKFWGDEVEEEDNDEAITSIFEQHYPSMSESTKAERKQKKHVNKVKPTSFNSVEMRTRAQKGTSKVALAYTE